MRKKLKKTFIMDDKLFGGRDDGPFRSCRKLEAHCSIADANWLLTARNRFTNDKNDTNDKKMMMTMFSRYISVPEELQNDLF